MNSGASAAPDSSDLRVWIAGYLVDFALARRRAASRMSSWWLGSDAWRHSPLNEGPLNDSAPLNDA